MYLFVFIQIFYAKENSLVKATKFINSVVFLFVFRSYRVHYENTPETPSVHRVLRSTAVFTRELLNKNNFTRNNNDVFAGLYKLFTSLE